MTEEFFHEQLKRLRAKWPKAFDPESTKLIASHCAMMTNESFLNLVNVFIGSRPVTRPPLPVDFLEEAKRAESRDLRFKAASTAAHSALSPWRPLPEVLAQTDEFKGCQTVGEAIEVARLRLRVKDAK